MMQSSTSAVQCGLGFRSLIEKIYPAGILTSLEQQCQRADADEDDSSLFRPATSEQDTRQRQQFRQKSLQDLLGPPALLPEEDPAAFEELLSRVSAMLKPRDILEQIWIRDFVYFAWEQDRFRRIKVSLCNQNDLLFELSLVHIARVDQMSLRAGTRRDAVLREIERYRNSAVLQPEAQIEEAGSSGGVAVGETQDEQPAED